MTVTSQTKSLNYIHGMSFHVKGYLFESRDMKRYPGDIPKYSKAKTYTQDRHNVDNPRITLGYPWTKGTYPRGPVFRCDRDLRCTQATSILSKFQSNYPPFQDESRWDKGFLPSAPNALAVKRIGLPETE